MVFWSLGGMCGDYFESKQNNWLCSFLCWALAPMTHFKKQVTSLVSPNGWENNLAGTSRICRQMRSPTC